MQRPFGVTLLAIGSALVGLAEVWRALVFMGWVNFTFVGETVHFPNPQWGQVIWAVILAAIWFWVAAGFWNVRAYAWSFGNFMAVFTLIWGFHGPALRLDHRGGDRAVAACRRHLLLPELSGRPEQVHRERDVHAHA